MDKEILKKYLKAGEIAAKARDYGASLAKEGIDLLDMAESIERKIKELGGEPAFPVNLSLNDIAAHFTPTKTENPILKAEDYLKIDVGVHIDGYIGDTAVTVRPAGKDELILCAEKMLEKAIGMMKPKTKLGEIGEVIENTAKEFGFKPIRNLTGHGLERFDLHARVMVPNIKTDSNYEIKEGEVYAVEPFCTSGAGLIKDSEPVLIFGWISDKSTRLAEARKILDLAKNKYNTLPFAKRWILNSMPPLKAEMGLKQLVSAEAIHPFNPLREISKANIAQAEHTIIVSYNPIVTTRV